MSLKALYSASTGMEAQQVRINNVANNLANINTAGYKLSRESFEDLVYDQIQTPGTNNSSSTESPVGIQIGHGTRLVGAFKHFTQGEFTQSDRPLDIAIEGTGFLQVVLENGETAYTRDGGLKLNADGSLVNNRGLLVEPSITIPQEATSVTVASDGTISAAVSGDPAPQILGQLQLATFQNPSGLQSLGQNLFQETAASGTPTSATPGEDGAGSFLQGFLESSNVNVSEELIHMIVAQRTYEANSRVLAATNEMMRSANNII